MNFKALENLGRERLSESFFMREFLHSEISQVTGIANVPDKPNIALENGRQLCQRVLEPIQNHFGRLFVRSGYRNPKINSIGSENRNQYRCASNKQNYARHIWDYPDKNGYHGAMACIVIPSYLSYYERTKDWESLANWIQDNIPEYSEMIFHPKLCALNISWHERPNKKIHNYIRK